MSDIALASSVRSRSRPRISALIVTSATVFNFLLCFLNTHGLAVSASTVIGSEIVIIGSAFFVSHRALTVDRMNLLLFFAAYLIILWLLAADFHPKFFRDILIPIAFLTLGLYAHPADGDETVALLVILVAAVALVEWLFLGWYLRHFDILSFYIDKGAVNPEQARVLATNLFVSGMRPEGRTMLAFLGDHRVSSIFLEPISAGNFAAICFGWLFTRWRRVRGATWLMAVSLGIAILADNRLAVALCALFALATVMPRAILTPLLTVAPIGAAAAIFAAWWLYPAHPVDDSVIGRLVGSAQLLSSFSIADWFGVGHVTDAATVDSGYGYLISQAGIFGCIALWTAFLVSCKSRTSNFHFIVGLYLTGALCITTSIFSIKTAALLWFLLGTTQSEMPDARG